MIPKNRYWKILKLWLAILGILLIVFVFSPIFSKKIYLILSKTSLYNTTSYSVIHEHDDEEKELAYFENEFNLQPYVNPMESSIQLIQLSISLLILSLFINNLKHNK